MSIRIVKDDVLMICVLACIEVDAEETVGNEDIKVKVLDE